MEGSIVRVHVENFITFRDLKVYPNPFINFITGPNGTGKSSLMCAICLGLAGKPRVVGRASSVSEYIRYNAERSKIDLELYNPKGVNHKISRTIFRDNKSTWSINDFVCTQKEVEKLAVDLNIQVDNMCQFLPQDRVQDFAKMNCQTLMENTEKAVGGLEMWSDHMKLKELGNAFLEIEKNLSTKKEHLANEEKMFESLQVVVDKVESKKALINKLDKLLQKRAYAQYTKCRMDQEMGAKVLKTKVALRKRLEKENQPLVDSVAKEKKKVNLLDEKNKDIGMSYTKLNSTCDVQFDLPEAINDQIKNNVQNFDRWCRNEKQQNEKLNDTRLQIEYLENTIKEMSDSEEGYKEKEAKLFAKEKEQMKLIHELQVQKQTILRKVDDVEHQLKFNEKELSKAKDVGEMKLMKFKTMGLYEPIMWFRENKNKLRGKAYEPMAMVINMKNDRMAKYLENIIPHRDLIAFVCEDPEDANLLMEELKDKKKLKINVITSKPTTPMTSFTRPYEIENLRQCGFHSFVSDTFTAPETVKRYLFKNCNIHRIPIGDETTYMKANEVPREIKTFMTENKKFTTRMSRYTSEIISSSTDLKASVFLTASVNEAHVKECVARIATLKKELKEFLNERASLESELRKYDEKMQSIKISRSEMKGALTKISSYKTRIANLKKNEKELMQKRISEEEQHNKLEKENQDCAVKLVSALIQNISNLKKYGDIVQSMQLTQKEAQKARHDVYLLEQDLRTSNEKVKEAEKDEMKFRHVLDEAHCQTERHLRQLEEYCKMKINSPSFQKLLEDFKELPDTINEIEKEIHETQTKADCLGHSDKNAISEYERRKKTLAAIGKAVEQLTSDLIVARYNIEEVKSRWLPLVYELVGKINSTFGDLLAKINYVGEVLLVKGHNEEDFSNYGFKIQVKFRQEGGLQELNQYRQSGGERAVAIAIYLMSLQELTSVPFRCVDEINQGMDEFHEAIVFKLLSEIVSSKNSAQYFLFTPKVLTSLHFTDNILFICVNNGEIESENFNCKDFIKERKKLKHRGPER